MEVKIKLDKGAIMPTYATNGSAGLDLYVPENFWSGKKLVDLCKYCKELTTNQVITVIVMIVVALILVGVVNWVVNKIPVIGGLGVLAINLVTLIILAVIIYVFYVNIRIHKTGK